MNKLNSNTPNTSNILLKVSQKENLCATDLFLELLWPILSTGKIENSFDTAIAERNTKGYLALAYTNSTIYL